MAKNALEAFISHDYCHCANEECPKKDTCQRYILYLEDKNGYRGWCAYSGFKPDDSGECGDYINSKDYE